MRPVLARTLMVALALASMVLAPVVGADGLPQVRTATPRSTPRVSPLPTRTPRVTATPIMRQGDERTPTPTQDRPTATPREPLVTRTVTAPAMPLQPAPAGTRTPGALPETGEQPQPGGPLSSTYDENLLRNLGQLETFRYESTVTWDLDNGRSGEADVVTEVMNRPPAQRWQIDIREARRPEVSYEIVRVAGQTYMNVAGQWREVMPSVQALVNRFAWVVDPQAYLDLSEGAFLGVETVAGIEAERYRYFSPAFDASRGPFELEGARADLWIDRQREVLVRAHLLLVGTDPLGGSGAYTIDSTLTAVDEPLTIEAPTLVSPEDLPPTGETELILADAIKLPQFETYRLDATLRWELESGERGNVGLQADVDQGAPAERAEVTVGQGPLRMEFLYVNIDGAAYVRSGERWIPAEQFALPALVEQLGWIGDPRSFVQEGEGRLVGRETVNGLPTEHYIFQREALGSLPFLSEVDDAQVDAWYAPDHDAYIRLRARLEGVDSRNVRGEYTLTSDVTDVNAPITIERPPDFPEE